MIIRFKFRKKFSFSLLFMMFVGLYSCSSTKNVATSSTKKEDLKKYYRTINNPNYFNSDSNDGLIILSITIIDERPRYDMYNLVYKHKGDELTFFKGRVNKIGITPTGKVFKIGFTPDFSIDNRRVHLFVLEKVPGEYEFIDFELFSNIGIAQSTFSFKKKFSIPFEVEKGKINYLGDMIFYPNGNENGYFIEWKDNLERDILEFKKKIDKIDWNLVQNKTLKQGLNIPSHTIEFITTE